MYLKIVIPVGFRTSSVCSLVRHLVAKCGSVFPVNHNEVVHGERRLTTKESTEKVRTKVRGT